MPTFEGYIQLDYAAFRKGIKEMEAMLNKQESELNTKYNEVSSKEGAEYASHYMQYDFMTFSSMVTLQRNAQFNALYSFFEVQFRKLCDYMVHDLQLTSQVADMKGGNYVERSKNFIAKALGVDLSSLNREWQLILSLQRIRNLISHGEGEFNKESQELESDVTYKHFKVVGLEHFEIREYNGTVYFKLVDDSLHIKFIDLQERFFKELVKLLHYQHFTKK